MPTPVSLLAFFRAKIVRLPVWLVRLSLSPTSRLSIAVCAFSCVDAGAFTQVTIGTAAPAGIEESFLAATTAQFNARIVKNPLAAHTYSMTILGPNPTYQAPPPPPSTLDQALSLGSTVYVYGFGAGQDYQRNIDQHIIGDVYGTCVSTSTCFDGLGKASNLIYQESLSTPTVIPGGQ